MPQQGYFRTPGRLLALIASIAGALFAVLGWLAWRMLEQDLALEKQRQRERIENAATLLSRELERTLADWEKALSRDAPDRQAELPPGSSGLWVSSHGSFRRLGAPLPFYPGTPQPVEPMAVLFARAEEREFRQEDPAAASAEYRLLAGSSDARVRGAALMRLARCLRKQGRLREALVLYVDLSALGETSVAGSPAELLGLGERIRLLQELGDEAARVRETALLIDALHSGRYIIDRTTFDFYHQLLPPASAGTVPSLDRAEALQAAWTQLEPIPGPASRRLVWVGRHSSFVTLWLKGPGGTAMAAVEVGILLSMVRAAIEPLSIRFRLEDADGRAVWGDDQIPSGIQAVKSAREAGLPFAVRVASHDPAAEQAMFSRRRNLAAAGFLLMLAMTAAALYVIYRAVSRELNVARLQSEFVSAVSHEFRTPLTALCHISEMLAEGSVEARQAGSYFSALARESQRLRGMVESLLDFARTEAGRQVYHPEVCDAATVVRDIVQEFREQALAGASRVEVEGLAEGFRIRVDREAIARAVWNLIDNAVKYSPESAPVRLSVQARHGQVAIAVEDRGPGIPERERREILRKFVRGSAAQAMHVKGTGIGLAMVNHIVKAHGGRLKVESEAGRGSRFTLFLPSAKEPA